MVTFYFKYLESGYIVIFLGIKLKNNVVIIDEAHNLLEALAQMHSTSVTQAQLHHAHIQLQNYKQRYSTRFSSKNLLCINQITFIVKKLLDLLSEYLIILGIGQKMIFAAMFSVIFFKCMELIYYLL